MTDLSLTISRKINASPEVVFNAWLDPEMLARFMLPGEGMSVPSAKTDPVEGGRFEIVMRAGDQDMPHKGTYTEISRHSRLAFTYRMTGNAAFIYEQVHSTATTHDRH